MRNLILSILLLMSATTLNAARTPKMSVQRVDPTCWYAGMKNPQLQLMMSGPGIAAVTDVSTSYPGVSVDSVVRLDSPNYLFVYLNLRGAQPGTMQLTLKPAKGKTLTVSYGGFTDSFAVTVREKALTSIALSAQPEKREYLVGEALDLSGGMLTLRAEQSTTGQIRVFTTVRSWGAGWPQGLVCGMGAERDSICSSPVFSV